MYYVCKPTRIQIYVNTGLKSATQIQKELGCDVLINGGLYDMTWYVPYCWLRVDGKTLRSEAWSDWGYGWELNKLVMDTSDNVKFYRNFISCVALIRNGAPIRPLSYDKALGGKRGRTAIGVRDNGEVIVLCTQDGSAYSLTPEQLQTEMLNLGAVSALMMDGGLSSQCIMPIGNISSSRNVHNYIAIWTRPIGDDTTAKCPYQEPTHTVGRWCFFYSKDEAKWVQWNLVRKGYLPDYNEVDGAFGPKSDKALRSFQKDAGLVADGFCGPKTREVLKK